MRPKDVSLSLKKGQKTSRLVPWVSSVSPGLAHLSSGPTFKSEIKRLPIFWSVQFEQSDTGHATWREHGYRLAWNWQPTVSSLAKPG